MQNVLFWHQDVWHNNRGKCFTYWSVFSVGADCCLTNVLRVLIIVRLIVRPQYKKDPTICCISFVRSFDNWAELLTGTGFCDLEKRDGALCGAYCGFDGLGWSNSFSFLGTLFGILKSTVMFLWYHYIVIPQYLLPVGSNTIS